MSVGPIVQERDEQLSLLSAFIRNGDYSTPKSSLIYGSPATGKSHTVKQYLEQSNIKYSWIQCDECVSFRMLLKRILRAIQIDSGIIPLEEVSVEFDSTVTFDNFIAAIQDFVTTENYETLHYIVLDRADRFQEEGEDLFAKFVKMHEISRVMNFSIIFITSTQPRRLITAAIPTIFFENYDNEQITKILGSQPECGFSKHLQISADETQRFWRNYVAIIVESYFPYTTNISVLRRIAVKLWKTFTKDIENGNLGTHDFLTLYRQNVNLLSSNYAFETSLEKETTNNDNPEVQEMNSSFPVFSKYIILAGYLASFNDPKYDWVFFSRLKDFHKKKQHFRTSKYTATKLNSRLLEPSPFELERLLAITHAIYTLENAKPLPSNLDLFSQIANLSSLKIILKSHNTDFISAKTKWKINVNFPYVKSLADDLNFPIENYLAE